MTKLTTLRREAEEVLKEGYGAIGIEREQARIIIKLCRALERSIEHRDAEIQENMRCLGATEICTINYDAELENILRDTP